MGSHGVWGGGGEKVLGYDPSYGRRQLLLTGEKEVFCPNDPEENSSLFMRLLSCSIYNRCSPSLMDKNPFAPPDSFPRFMETMLSRLAGSGNAGFSSAQSQDVTMGGKGNETRLE